eukprot:TRINITY_DN10755_c0_g1_i1.p1 TRINITY_DN10755_c0_g1~~TRINITY_DN10755_c0_g1_i1.p1  ORF type:complete len:143 (-),score=4.29 TRINITY_DN10755_c0_g1_i1:285-713(-)
MLQLRTRQLWQFKTLMFAVPFRNVNLGLYAAILAASIWLVRSMHADAVLLVRYGSDFHFLTYNRNVLISDQQFVGRLRLKTGCTSIQRVEVADAEFASSAVVSLAKEAPIRDGLLRSNHLVRAKFWSRAMPERRIVLDARLP